MKSTSRIELRTMMPASAMKPIIEVAVKGTGRTHGRTDQCCKSEESPCQLGAVHTWHFSDIAALAHVRFAPTLDVPITTRMTLNGRDRCKKLDAVRSHVLG